MKTINRLLLCACLALPLAACQQEEEVQETTEAAAPLTAPQTEDINEGRENLIDHVGRHMDGIYNQSYVDLVPPRRGDAAEVDIEDAEGADAAEQVDAGESGETTGPELVDAVNES